jgi:hypothetical protein
MRDNCGTLLPSAATVPRESRRSFLSSTGHRPEVGPGSAGDKGSGTNKGCLIDMPSRGAVFLSLVAFARGSPARGTMGNERSWGEARCSLWVPSDVHDGGASPHERSQEVLQEWRNVQGRERSTFVSGVLVVAVAVPPPLFLRPSIGRFLQFHLPPPRDHGGGGGGGELVPVRCRFECRTRRTRGKELHDDDEL